MRRVVMLSILMVFFLVIITQPVTADAQIEIIISDNEVFENEEFSFDAKFTNPDALAYDTFHLYGEGTEELNWGYHMFQGEDYTLYTERYTIGLGELGYYTIYVAVFAMFDSSIPEITDSISIHVIERPQSLHPLSVLFILAAAGVLVVCIYYLFQSRGKGGREMKKRGARVGIILIAVASFFFWLETVLPTPNPSNDYSVIGFPLGFLGIVILIVSIMRKDTPPPRVEPSKIDRPGYREPAPLVLIICLFCGAKNEQGVLKCRVCSAEM